MGDFNFIVDIDFDKHGGNNTLATQNTVVC